VIKQKTEIQAEPVSDKKKFITISDLKSMGYTYYKTGRLEKDGKVKRVNRSTYENLFYAGDENDFFSAEAYVPEGVICLMSAARYYGLTNFLPNVVYLRTLGFDVMNDIFAENAWYFRNSLVRANYNDLKNGIHETTEFLEVFLRNLLLNENHPLHNRTLHISGTFKETEKPDIELAKPDMVKGSIISGSISVEAVGFHRFSDIFP